MGILTKKFYTPAEYLKFEETSEARHEYLVGRIYELAGASLNHNQIVINLIRKLPAMLRGKPCRVFGSDMRVLVKASGAYTYPDVTVVCGEIELAAGRDDTITNPSVIVEVLSNATADYDRGRKFDLYRAIKTLQAYMLVDQNRAHVGLFHRLPDNTWELQTFEAMSDKLRIKPISCALTRKPIYDKVEFASPKSSDNVARARGKKK
jgi:Uma2 family endonuclease